MPDGTGTPRLPVLDEAWERALAVVAHPDDMEYGAAAAVARWTSHGKVVRYLLVTRGEAGIDSMEPALVGPLREAEQREAAAVVGVERVDFLGYPDGQVEYGVGLRRDLAAAIREFRPEVLVSLNYRLEGRSGTNMADHRAVGVAVLDAVRDAGNRWVFPELTEGGLEPWGGVRMAVFAASPCPTHVGDVSGMVGERDLVAWLSPLVPGRAEHGARSGRVSARRGGPGWCPGRGGHGGELRGGIPLIPAPARMTDPRPLTGV